MARHGAIGHPLESSNGRPPPAFYGVPPAPGNADPSQAVISVNGDSIRIGMDVYDYDGAYVGPVKDVLDTSLRITRRWRSDMHVPLEQILAVLDRRVVLTVPRAQAGMNDRA